MQTSLHLAAHNFIQFSLSFLFQRTSIDKPFNGSFLVIIDKYKINSIGFNRGPSSYGFYATLAGPHVF